MLFHNKSRYHRSQLRVSSIGSNVKICAVREIGRNTISLVCFDGCLHSYDTPAILIRFSSVHGRNGSMVPLPGNHSPARLSVVDCANERSC